MPAKPKPKRERVQLPGWLKPKGAPRGKAFPPGNAYAWRPGESGNPAGTPGPKLSTRLAEALSLPMPADRQRAYWELIEAGASMGEITAFAIALMSADGDLSAAGFIADRTEGAPEQTVRQVAMTSDDLAKARDDVAAWERERRGSPPAAAPAESPAPASPPAKGARRKRAA